MISVSLDMYQPDCPLTQTTVDHEVEFSTVYWDFSPSQGQWDLRIRATASEQEVLEEGLIALREYDTMHTFELYRKLGGDALLRTVFDQTEAIETISDHSGIVIGPFHNFHGREQWKIGFDTASEAEDTLAELDRHNEFTVQRKQPLDMDTFFDVLYQHRAAATLLDGINELTKTERRVLRTAFENGYFDTPRDETLQSLGHRLDISDVAVSKTLRRAERKILSSVIATFTTVSCTGSQS